MRTTVAVGLVALFVGLGAAPALATGEPARSSDEVSRISRELSQEIFSPFCPGKTLAMCPSSAAADARREMQDLAYGGMSKDEIKELFIERYGEEFRLVEPPAEDNYKLLGAIGAGFGVAIVAVVALARRRTLQGGAAADELGSDEPLDSDEDALYLEELRSEVHD